MNVERRRPVAELDQSGSASTIAPSKETGWMADDAFSAPTGGPTCPLPANIGPYRVVRMLGEGGMGIVYEAEQESPRRIVALKLLKPGFANPNPELRRRFAQESWALGRLQHPGIAQIYEEAGTAEAGFGPQPISLWSSSAVSRCASMHKRCV